jgi:hypothetical protein
MARFFCILCFVATTNISFAQTDNVVDKKNSLQFNFGFIHSRMIDQGYTNSHLLFRGTNPTFDLRYGRKTNRYFFNVSLEASVGKVKSQSDNLPSDFYLIYPSITYARKIKSYTVSGKENTFFAGIHFSSINYYLENEAVFDNIDIFSLHGIYINFSNRLRLSKNQSLQLTYLMPVIVYANRVLWNGGASAFTYYDRDHVIRTLASHGRYLYFSVMRNIQLDADYTLRISKRTDFEVKYRFFYSNGFTQSPIHIYTNELLVGLKLKF